MPQLPLKTRPAMRLPFYQVSVPVMRAEPVKVKSPSPNALPMKLSPGISPQTLPLPINICRQYAMAQGAAAPVDENITQIEPGLYLGRVENVAAHVAQFHSGTPVTIINAYAIGQPNPLALSKECCPISSQKFVLDANTQLISVDDFHHDITGNGISIHHCRFEDGNQIVNIFMRDSTYIPINKIFDYVADLIASRKDNSVVYVVCQEGKSRSVTLLLAYQLKHQGKSNAELAVSELKTLRPQITPNLAFLIQLIGYCSKLQAAKLELVDEVADDKILMRPA